MNIGSKISNFRKKANMTQLELANLLFVTDKTISSYESNRTEPSLDVIMKLSEIFGCNPSDFLSDVINDQNIETEIKIKLTEEEFYILEERLKREAKFIKETKQSDTYYQPTYRKFLDGDIIKEWLRIGSRGNKTILNYKNWYDNMYCDEYEVTIDNKENLDKIFGILGLEKIAVVNKKRKTYLYLDKYEIALDDVETLGYFVEIEVKKYTESVLREYDLLLELAKKLNLNLKHIDKRGYPYHLIYQNNR